MNKWVRTTPLSVACVLGMTAAAMSPRPVAAQAPAGAQQASIEELVVLGTRRQGRAAVDTAVPVDFFQP